MKRRRYALWPVICLALLSVAAPCTAAIPYTERDALVALYTATNGPGWTDSTGWLGAPGTECSWYGVTCSGDTVTGLNLISDNLVGTIPPLLANLSNLELLYLSDNDLAGSIPPQLGSMLSLTNIDLSSNDLAGSIPSQLGSLSNLWVLVLADNDLGGAIPPQLGSLSSLHGLDLSDNQLTGSIPTFSSAASLYSLDLSYNQLTGSIPPQLGSLSNLQYLILDHNHLSGSIPSQLGDPAGLYYLKLSVNRLSGGIPSTLGTLSNLTVLDLSLNQLRGNMPPDLADITSVDVRYNALWTDDPTLQAALDAQYPVWDETQTVAPEDVSAGTPGSSSVLISWTPITYTDNSGGYYVFVTPSPPSDTIFSDGFEGGDCDWWGLPGWWVRTTDKTDTSLLVEGLAPGTTYDLTVRTVTESSEVPSQQNQVISDPSATVSITTAAGPP